jgi:hypothetical protein
LPASTAFAGKTTQIRNNEICVLLIISPPTIANVTHDNKWSEAEVDNACVQGFGRLFAQLLGCFSTNGALRLQIGG